MAMELAPDHDGTPGFWVEWFADKHSWVWYKLDDYDNDVEVISESR